MESLNTCNVLWGGIDLFLHTGPSDTLILCNHSEIVLSMGVCANIFTLILPDDWCSLVLLVRSPTMNTSVKYIDLYLFLGTIHWLQGANSSILRIYQLLTCSNHRNMACNLHPGYTNNNNSIIDIITMR